MSKGINTEIVSYAKLQGYSKRKMLADERDKKKVLDILRDNFCDGSGIIWGYCVMDNEVHLVLGTKEASGVRQHLKEVVKQFNRYYQEKGYANEVLALDALEQLEDMNGVWERLRQIHELPVQEGIVKRPGDYWWCSYNCFIGKNPYRLVPADKLMGRLHQDHQKALRIFRSIHRNNNSICLFIYKNESESKI